MENENKETKQVEQSKDKSKKKKILKYVLNGVVWGVILGFLIYSGLKVIDVKTGYNLLPTHSAVIVSDSMSFVNEENYSYLDKDVEHIKKNDVVHTVNYKSFDDVKPVEDVILYLSDNGALICHRVIDKYVDNDVQYVVTRGDANNADDAPIKFELVRGRVNSVTGGGGAVLFFQSPYFVLALCGTGFFILLGYLIFNLKTEKSAAGVEETSTTVDEPKPEEQPVEEPKQEEKNEEEPEPEVAQESKKEEKSTSDQEALNKKMAELKVAQEATKKAEEKAKEAEARARAAKEGIAKDKPEQPARVNGRFVSKNPAKSPAKPASNGSRWTKDNNPSANKKRAQGGEK